MEETGLDAQYYTSLRQLSNAWIMFERSSSTLLLMSIYQIQKVIGLPSIVHCTMEIFLQRESYQLYVTTSALSFFIVGSYYSARTLILLSRITKDTLRLTFTTLRSSELSHHWKMEMRMPTYTLGVRTCAYTLSPLGFQQSNDSYLPLQQCCLGTRG